jgi:hypothetical protein
VFVFKKCLIVCFSNCCNNFCYHDGRGPCRHGRDGLYHIFRAYRGFLLNNCLMLQRQKTIALTFL